MSTYIFTLRYLGWATIILALIVAVLAAEFGPMAWCNSTAREIACGVIA